MDANIFQEPSKFDPVRFENQATIPPYCFVPFGGGARICPGNEFARIETLVTIHYLVTRFTWKLCCTDDTFSRVPVLVPNQGLPIQIMPKKLPSHWSNYESYSIASKPRLLYVCQANLCDETLFLLQKKFQIKQLLLNSYCFIYCQACL